MNYFIYDENGVKQAPLQNYTSIQWKPRYYESGMCEIHARPTADNVKYLKKWNRIVCQERNEILFISFVQRTDKSAKDEIVVKGYLDNLDQRINPSVAKIKNVEADLLNLVNTNKRGLEVIIPNPSGISASYVQPKKTSHKKLSETFKEVCSDFDLGWKMIIKGGLMNCLFIYEGQLKKRAKFSDAVGNVIGQKYIDNVTDFANYAYVFGEGEGNSRKMVTVDSRQGAEPLVEVYIDARDVQSTYTDAYGTEQKYTDLQYTEMLRERGQKKLNELRKKSFEFSFELNSENEIAKLGSDYDLGDIVPVISNRFNLFTHVRITGINFIEENNQKTKIKLQVKIEDMKGVSL